MKRSLLLTAAAAALPLASGVDESRELQTIAFTEEEERLWEELSEVMQDADANPDPTEEQWAELAAIMEEHDAMMEKMGEAASEDAPTEGAASQDTPSEDAASEDAPSSPMGSPAPTPSPTEDAARVASAPGIDDDDDGGGGAPCSGDPCPFDTWCRSRYGSCGHGFMFCDERSTWEVGCRGFPVAEGPGPTTPSPTEPTDAPEISEPPPDASGNSVDALESVVVGLPEEEVETAPDSAMAVGEEVSTSSAGESDQGSSMTWVVVVVVLGALSFFAIGVALRRAKTSDDLERARWQEWLRDHRGRDLDVV